MTLILSTSFHRHKELLNELQEEAVSEEVCRNFRLFFFFGGGTMCLMPVPIVLSPNDELPPAESRRVNSAVL